MKEKPIIQRLLASLLLVFFTISFIPKSIFHDLIASHTDTVSCEHPDKKTACIHQQGFKCPVNDLVVSAPYIPFSSGFSLLKPLTYSSFLSNFHTSLLEQCFFGTESRGPPRIVV